MLHRAYKLYDGIILKGVMCNSLRKRSFLFAGGVDPCRYKFVSYQGRWSVFERFSYYLTINIGTLQSLDCNYCAAAKIQIFLQFVTWLLSYKMGIWYCSVAYCKSKSSENERNSIRFFGFPVIIFHSSFKKNSILIMHRSQICQRV